MLWVAEDLEVEVQEMLEVWLSLVVEEAAEELGLPKHFLLTQYLLLLQLLCLRVSREATVLLQQVTVQLVLQETT